MEPNDITTVWPSRFNQVVLGAATLGLYYFWLRRTVYEVTPEEIRIERGIFRRDEVLIPRGKLVAVKAKLSPFAGQSSVVCDTGAGETAETPRLSRRDARRFAAACEPFTV